MNENTPMSQAQQLFAEAPQSGLRLSQGEEAAGG